MRRWKGAVRCLSDIAKCLCDCTDRVSYAHIRGCGQRVGQRQIAERREIPRTSRRHARSSPVPATPRGTVIAQIARSLVAQELLYTACALGQLLQSGREVAHRRQLARGRKYALRRSGAALVQDVGGYFRMYNGAWLRPRCRRTQRRRGGDMASAGRGDGRGRPCRTGRIVCSDIFCFPLRSLARCDIAIAAVEVVPADGDGRTSGAARHRYPTVRPGSTLTARISCRGSLTVHRTFALSLGLFEMVPGRKRWRQ